MMTLTYLADILKRRVVYLPYTFMHVPYNLARIAQSVEQQTFM